MGVPGSTLLAFLARHRRGDGDAKTGARSRLDDAGGFVAEQHRLGQPYVADPRLGEPVKVRAADADRLHADEFFARPGNRWRLVDEPQFARPHQAKRLHALAPDPAAT